MSEKTYSEEQAKIQVLIMYTDGLLAEVNEDSEVARHLRSSRASLEAAMKQSIHQDAMDHATEVVREQMADKMGVKKH